MRDYETVEARYEDEAIGPVPLVSAVDRTNNHADSIHETIDKLYKRLDHLVFHGPEMDTQALASVPKAHSDTVLRLEGVATKVQEANERLMRLLRIVEA